jgi:hypothetical protein
MRPVYYEFSLVTLIFIFKLQLLTSNWSFSHYFVKDAKATANSKPVKMKLRSSRSNFFPPHVSHPSQKSQEKLILNFPVLDALSPRRMEGKNEPSYVHY